MDPGARAWIRARACFCKLRYAEAVACQRPARDHELVQIVEAALGDAARRAGPWLVCRPGCAHCCVGAFAINALDAARLRDGLANLRRNDPIRANRIRQRASAYIDRVAPQFPGDPDSGILDESIEAEERFLDFADDEVCPALDPESGTCDLYEFRPMTCRVFGPPVRNEGGGLGVCELCFHGASNADIAACEMQPDPGLLEDVLLAEIGKTGNTLVAFALAR
jgi:Fe-S-cluster containining protein